MFKEVVSNSDLSFAIKQKKAELIILGEQYGLQDKQTIDCSQELDTLLNKHLLRESIQEEHIC